MKNLIFTFLLSLLVFASSAQEKGLLMHYQKKGTNCLALAGEKYDASKFFIIVADSVYSGGTIRLKCIEEGNFKAKKVLFSFDKNKYTGTQFYIKGKKDVAAFTEWIKPKISNDQQGNSMLRVINGQSVSLVQTVKGRKLHVNIQTVD